MSNLAQRLVEVCGGFAPSPRLQPVASPLAADAGDRGASSHLYFATSDPGNDSNRTVRATRRRRTTSDASQRDTASAPTRDDRPSSGGAPPPQSPQPSGGFRMPGGRRGGFSWIILLLALAILVLPRLFGGGGANTPDAGNGGESTAPTLALEASGFEQGQGALSQAAPAASSASSSSSAAASASQGGSTSSSSGSGVSSATTAGGDTWTIMLYQDADDKVLEEDIMVDLNEAELMGSTGNVQIVAQIDRYRGGYSADGNWTSTKRFEVTRDRDLNRVNSREVQDLGEANMADGQTLVDFVKWAVQNYPADKYALVLSDHGMGWPGGWTDPTSNQGGDRSLPLSSALGDMIYLHELDAALAKARQEAGIDKFELVGMDACLMADIAVFTMLADHALYAVASQETEPALGWAYAAYLDALNQKPQESGAALGEAIVQTYVAQDERVGGNRASAAKIERGTTLTAVDLSYMGALNQALNDLTLAMQDINPKIVAQARSYAQNFTNIFGGQVPPSFIDLGHFALLVAQASQQAPEINGAVRGLVEALSSAVVAEKSGEGKPGATGISIYFPTNELYGSPMAGPASFNVAAGRFVDESLWDEFLTYFYTGRNFDATAAGARAPEVGEITRAPAAGGITVSPIRLSQDSVSPGETVLLSADIQGENIGYVKYLVGRRDPAANSIVWMDSDYLDAGAQKELNGVYYPDWGEGDFTLEFEWEPYTLGVNDGQTTGTALFTPQEYGLNPEATTYTVDGLYTYADGSQYPTKVYFRNDESTQFFSFNAQGDTADPFTGAPREITPADGDTFTLLERWVDLDDDGSVAGVAYENGTTVEAGGGALQVKELNLPAGEYVIGLVVEDLDGNATASYTPISVQ